MFLGEVGSIMRIGVAGSFRRMSLISGFEQLCPSTKLNPCNSSPRQSKLHHESPRSSDQFFRVRMRKLKSKFRVSPRPFVPSKFNNIPRSLEFPFFRVSRGICPGIARFKPGQRRSKNHATDDDPYAPYKILNLPSCFRYLPETDYPWKSE